MYIVRGDLKNLQLNDYVQHKNNFKTKFKSIHKNHGFSPKQLQFRNQ